MFAAPSFVGEVQMTIFRHAVQASPWTATVLASILLAGCAGAVQQGGQVRGGAPAVPASAAALTFTSVDKSAASRIDAPRTVVVKDHAAWRRLWAEHAGPDAAPPPVDFATGMVVGVFLGSRPSPCYSTAIVGLESVDGKIRVQQVDTIPGPTVRCMMMIATPAHLVLTARSEAAVEFATKTLEL